MEAIKFKSESRSVKLTSIEKIISNLTADLRVTGIDAVTSINTLAGNDTISTGSQTSEVSTGAGNDVLQLDGFGAQSV